MKTKVNISSNPQPVSTSKDIQKQTPMSLELGRIVSFMKYPLTAVKSAYRLAANGFYYIGSGDDDMVICFVCHAVKQNWTEEDVIEEVHREMSPDCSMVTGNACSNVPLNAPPNQRSSALLSLISSRYSFKDSQLAGETSSVPTNSGSGAVDEISASVARDVQRDSDPAAQQPTGQAVTISEISGSCTNQVKPSEPAQRSTRPIQMATTSMSRSSNQAAASSSSTSLPVSTTPSAHCQQPTNQDAPSRVLTSSNAALPPSSIWEAPRNERRNSSELSNVGTCGRLSSNQISASPSPASSASARPAASTTTTISASFSSATVSVYAPASGPSATTCQANSASQGTGSSVSSTTPSQPANASQQTKRNREAPSRTNPQSNANSEPPGRRQNPTYQELGIITERPKKYEYAIRASRLGTFQNWPAHHHLRKEDLADAGFYFAGYGDCARCFYCGGGLRNWEDNDDVWVEHARWFPKCAFIRQLMGQNFVDTVQDLNKEHEQISFEMVTNKMGVSASVFNIKSKETPLKRDPAVKAVTKFGYKESDVIVAALAVREAAGTISADKLFEELKKTGKAKSRTDSGICLEIKDTIYDPAVMDQLKEQNNQLRQQTVCKICMDKEVTIVFLPCGHFVSCTDCASALKDCPVCRNQVKAMVRAFVD